MSRGFTERLVPTTVQHPLCKKIMEEIDGKHVRTVFGDTQRYTTEIYRVVFIDSAGKIRK